MQKMDHPWPKLCLNKRHTNATIMKKEITILEDDQDIREICTFLFDSEGYKVNSYENVADFNSSSIIPDLYLLDIRLPDGNGLDVCKELKANPKYASVPVIMMSAHLERSMMKAKCGAEEFIEKPFHLNHLITTADQLIYSSRMR